MADKRMFSQKIIDSDAFLDMPTSAQALYFHLCMRADDDGFVNNPKKIRTFVGAADDDLKLLIAKNFLIPFDSGVVVIKHWRIHNYIQKDRYTPTAYTDEMAHLETKENKAYTLVSNLDTACIQDGYRLDAQNRLDKNRLDKIRLDEGSGGEDLTAAAVEPDALAIYASSNLTYMSPNNMDELLSFRNTLTDDMIYYAIDQACGAGKRTYAYAKSILNRIIERGFKTIGEVKAAEEERKANKDSTAPSTKPEGETARDAIEKAKRAYKAYKPMDEREVTEADFDPLADIQSLMNRPRSGA